LFIRATPSSVSVRIDKKDYSRIAISSPAFSASSRVLIAEIGFVETLIEKQTIALGGSLHFMLPPPPLGHPRYCDTS